MLNTRVVMSLIASCYYPASPQFKLYRAQDLAIAYVANEADVDESFHDQLIEVTGRIAQIRRIVVTETTPQGTTIERVQGYAAMMIETVRENESHPETIAVRCEFPIDARRELAK